MATVTTTTQTAPLSAPTVPGIVRDQSTSGPNPGALYVIARTATDTLTVYRSTNNGTSWASYASFAHTGLQEWSSLQVDKYGYGHLAYRIGTGTADSLWYRRLSLWTATWSTELQISATDANGGVIGSRWVGGIDLAAIRTSRGTTNIAILANYSDGSGKYGLYGHGVSISANATIGVDPVNADSLFVGARTWLISGTSPGASALSVDIESPTGDGISAASPHVWVVYGRTTLRMIKLAWRGSDVGWAGSTNTLQIATGLVAHTHCIGRWDGIRFVMGVISPADLTQVRIYERNQANTSTSFYDSPSHPTGNVRSLSASYDNVTKDLRLFAVGTSTDVLYYIDFTRATGTWTTWATVVATAVLTSGNEWTVRRGGSAGNARIDVVTAHSGAPNTIVHTAQTTSSVPNIANWNTTAVPYFSGGAADVGASLTLDWDFTDPDPGDTQGSYAVSRQIGAGTLAYWRASDSTWQAAEVQNASGTTALTLASGWAAGTDAAYTYKVKVWDAGGIPAPGYSAGLVLIPSVKVNPAITAPTAAQVLTADTVTVTWTAAEQTAYRLRLSTNPGAVVVYDSGWVTDPATLSVTLPYRLPNATGWTVELTTRNNEGLASTAQTRNFTVAYAAPPAMTSVFTPSTANGWISVTGTALSPVGAQPAIASAELWRRPAISPALNANPSFATAVTSWTVGGGGTPGTLSFSTAVAAPPNAPDTGLARYVPNATGAAVPVVESSTTVDLVTGSSYLARGWIRPDTANKPILVALNWYTSGSVFISSTTTTVATPVAGAWHYLEVSADPATVPTAAKARVAVGESGTPAAADAFYADQVELEVLDSGAGIRVAQGLLPGTVVADVGAASGIAYEYRWIATGTNGTSIASPWQA